MENLKQEHESCISFLQDVGDMISYYEYSEMEAYHKWLIKTIRYIEIKYPNDKYGTIFQ